MSVLITGASGFIGKELVRSFLAQDRHVLCITRNKLRQKQDSKATWVSWDECDADFFKNNNIGVVIHLATAYGRDEKNSDVEYANVYLPLRLIELCSELSVPFINTDSFFSKKEFNCEYMMPYILTKRHLNSWAEIISLQKKDFKFINMRLEHVYGPNDAHNKFVSFIVREFKTPNNKVKCTTGTQKRDFIYIKDVVSAYTCVVNNIAKIESGCKEFQVGTGKSIMVREFIEQLKQEMCADDVSVLYGAIETRKNEIMDSKANVESLEGIGWRAKYNVRDGIIEMLNTEAY
ncbi:NAD-dependent epimerase/dehydratase [Aeromonas enteropelogenes]|uniref:NAD-dependent epimerase/dehydratase n=1 Tax=Aeromonas enteropelogenes TaxID=29489 RepID=UPI003B9E09EA